MASSGLAAKLTPLQNWYWNTPFRLEYRSVVFLNAENIAGPNRCNDASPYGTNAACVIRMWNLDCTLKVRQNVF
jgi:hypothetical protein